MIVKIILYSLMTTFCVLPLSANPQKFDIPSSHISNYGRKIIPQIGGLICSAGIIYNVTQDPISAGMTLSDWLYYAGLLINIGFLHKNELIEFTISKIIKFKQS